MAAAAEGNGGLLSPAAGLPDEVFQQVMGWIVLQEIRAGAPVFARRRPLAHSYHRLGMLGRFASVCRAWRRHVDEINRRVFTVGLNPGIFRNIRILAALPILPDVEIEDGAMTLSIDGLVVRRETLPGFPKGDWFLSLMCRGKGQRLHAVVSSLNAYDGEPQRLLEIDPGKPVRVLPVKWGKTQVRHGTKSTAKRLVIDGLNAEVFALDPDSDLNRVLDRVGCGILAVLPPWVAPAPPYLGENQIMLRPTVDGDMWVVGPSGRMAAISTDEYRDAAFCEAFGCLLVLTAFEPVHCPGNDGMCVKIVSPELDGGWIAKSWRRPITAREAVPFELHERLPGVFWCGGEVLNLWGVEQMQQGLSPSWTEDDAPAS